MIGASGAVFGLLLAFALNWPDAPIYIWGILPIRAKWFVGILGFFALFATISGGGDGVAHWAHLGGLATGYVYLRHGSGLGRNLSRLIWKERTPDEVRSEVEVVQAPRKASSRARPGPRRSGRAGGDALDRVDRILDKIRETGIESLSAEERAFLDDMSRKYREGPERTFH